MPNGGRERMGSSLKMWQRILSCLLVLSMAALIGCSPQNPKECCICNSFRYHAPCLVDLEAGEMIELALYEPHATKVGELAEDQPEIDTFSFVRLGNVTGTKLTGSRTIEIKVPTADQVNAPALCEKCRKMLNGDYTGRYVLADLYDNGSKLLYPMQNGTNIVLRCYEITMNEQNQEIIVTVQGILE